MKLETLVLLWRHISTVSLIKALLPAKVTLFFYIWSLDSSTPERSRGAMLSVFDLHPSVVVGEGWALSPNPSGLAGIHHVRQPLSPRSESC